MDRKLNLIHYARYDWVRTSCNLSITDDVIVVTRRESATCRTCRLSG